MHFLLIPAEWPKNTIEKKNIVEHTQFLSVILAMSSDENYNMTLKNF